MIMFDTPNRRSKTEIGRWIRHFREKHDEDPGQVVALLNEAKKDHPEMTTLQLLELIHNRQHTSEDWDASHPEEEIAR